MGAFHAGSHASDVADSWSSQTVLTTPELRASWIQELGEMRERIRQMRAALVSRLQAHEVEEDFSLR
jgi:aspartate/tyrosine/aromatic aminotransferase